MKTIPTRLAAAFAALAALLLLALPHGALAASDFRTNVDTLEHRIGVARAKAAIATARVQRFELLIAASRRKQDELSWQLEEAMSQVKLEGGANSIRSASAKRLKQLEHSTAAELEALEKNRRVLLRKRAHALAVAAIETGRSIRLEVIKLSVLTRCRVAETPSAVCNGHVATGVPQETK